MIQNALKFDSESMPMSIRVAWQRTLLSLVGGDEVDGRSVRALEHLGRLGVLGRLAVGAARARLAAGLALVAHLGLGVGLGLGLDLGLDVGLHGRRRLGPARGLIYFTTSRFYRSKLDFRG